MKTPNAVSQKIKEKSATKTGGYVLLYSAVFMLTQITGLILSLIICFVFKEFVWDFIQVALLNSFVLGVALILSSFATQKLLFSIKTIYIFLLSFLLILGSSIISFSIIFAMKASLFVYYYNGVLSFFLINYLFISSLAVITIGFTVYREHTARQERELHKETSLKNEMELKLLSSKMNPHFLFNSLNMLISLLKEPLKAEEAILDLSDLLRYNLHSSDNKTVPISDELLSVERYLNIQKLRFGDRLTFSITNSSSIFVPPLIIQPLVENSIKYNLQSNDSLTIEITVINFDGIVTILVKDSLRLLTEEMVGKGTGLTVTKKRIENSGGTFTITDGIIKIGFIQ